MKRTSFCSGWEFSRDGSSYAPVVVPHDAILGARRDAGAPGGSASGYFHGTDCYYRKHFSLTGKQAGEQVLLEFEGVYRNARIRMNGTPVHDVPPYGFVPFFVDLTDLVRVGENVLEVECGNAEQPDCRWYSGAGIYRPVWLWFGGEARILPEGVRVTTLSSNPAVVQVDVEHTGGIPIVSILDAQGKEVARARGSRVALDVPDAGLWSADTPTLYRCRVELEGADQPGSAASASEALDRTEVRFGIRTLSWSREGFFVNGRETLLRGGCIHCDNGILGAASFPESEWRRVRLLKDAGFNAIRVAHNPAPTALLEACDALGMYVIDETWDTWYTPKSAHDYSRHFLSWCDHDLRRLATRDRNHPSVIMYSIGNEVADPLEPQGVQLERSLVELLHSIDPTRPVTCGLNLTMMVMERAGRGWYGNADGVAEAATDTGAPHGSMLFNIAAQASGTGMTLLANVPGADKLVSPALDALDIAGYNYASARYGVDARKHPDRIVVGTETFPHELPRNWRAVKRLPNVIGDFMWAAWDYLGEAGAGAWAYTPEEAGFSKPWPWLLAGSGALDIFGNAGAPAALAAAVWDTAVAPSIQVRPVNRMLGRTYKATWRGSDAVPCWSWHGCEGIAAQVEVYDGRAHAIRLELNGRTVDEKRVRGFVARFSLPYEAGTLTAIALDAQGRELARSSLISACGPFHLEARVESAVGPQALPLHLHNEPSRHARHAEDAADALANRAIAYVQVNVVGSNGQLEANADEQLTAQVEGGNLLAFGSAQPAPTESFLTGTYTTYRGRAMAVVRRATPGIATLTVSGKTLGSVSAEVAFMGS